MGVATSPQQSLDVCRNRGASNLSSVMWSSRHCLFQRNALLNGRAQKPHSCKAFITVARVSEAGPSPGLYEPISCKIFHGGRFSSPCEASSALSEKILYQFESPTLISFRTSERWVCFGGGKRPRKPRIWKTRQRRGTINKSQKLLECIQSLSNVKEEVYGSLDAFIAWELDFPLITVKKALHALEVQKNWTRVIQVSKWMLGKGQGRTMSTYLLLLKAFAEEGRIDEAQELWKKVFSTHLDCTPISFFLQVMRMYERCEMHEDLLEVFADMEELDLRLNNDLVMIVSRTYEKVGMMEKAEKVRLKYPPPQFRWRTVGGKRIKTPNYKPSLEGGRQTFSQDSGPLQLASDEDSQDMRAADEIDLYGSSRGDDLHESLEDEDSRDYGSADDEEFQVENGHFQSRQAVGNEVYL